MRAGVVAAMMLPLLVACGGASDRPASRPTSSASPSVLPGMDATPGTFSPAPTSTAAPAVTVVPPTGLRRGADPKVPYLDPVAHVIHDGDREVPLTAGWLVASFVKAGSDYLVVSEHGSRTRVDRVAPSGRFATLVGRVDPAVVLSPDGRTFAWSRTSVRRVEVALSRTSDGKVLARRQWANQPEGDGYVDTLAVEPDRVLLSTYGRTWWWNLDDGSEQEVAPAMATTVEAAHDRLVLATGRDTMTRRVSAFDPDERAWALPRNWQPDAFSPGGAFLLGGRTREFDERGYDHYEDPLRVWAARSGRPVREFHGVFGFYEQGGSRWESDDTFLALAGTPRTNSTAPVTLRWVRCTTAGTCEAASPVFVFDNARTRRSPVWVLAQQ